MTIENNNLPNLRVVRAEISDYFKFFTFLGEKGFSPLDVKRNRDGFYSVIIMNDDKDRFPQVGFESDFYENPLEAAMSVVDKFEEFILESHKYNQSIKILGQLIDVNMVNKYIKTEGIKCVGLEEKISLNKHNPAVNGKAILVVLVDEISKKIEFKDISEDVLLEFSKKYDFNTVGILQKKIIVDICDMGLSKLLKKREQYFSKKGFESISNEFEKEISNLNAEISVHANNSYFDSGIDYRVDIQHNWYQIFARSDGSIRGKNTSYFSAKKKFKKSVENHVAKLQDTLKQNLELNYLVTGIESEFELGSQLCDVVDNNEDKEIIIFFPSLAKNIQKIHVKGKSWELVFKKLKEEYLDSVQSSKKIQSAHIRQGQSISATGLPASVILDLQGLNNQQEADQIIFNYLKKNINLKSQHTRIPPYFTPKKLEYFKEMAIASEDFETAQKIQNWL